MKPKSNIDEIEKEKGSSGSKGEALNIEMDLQDDESTKEESLENILEQNRKEYLELHDQYLRLAADFENFKKRVAKEKSDLVSYGNEELIKSLLGVLDNLERAIQHSETLNNSEPIAEGIKLVHKQFLGCLEKFGVTTIGVNKGDEFDPRIHQAVERVESNEIKPGLILSELLKGYSLKDRLLRPALVSVSIVHSEPKAVSIESDEKPPVADRGNGKTNDMLELREDDIETE